MGPRRKGKKEILADAMLSMVRKKSGPKREVISTIRALGNLPYLAKARPELMAYVLEKPLRRDQLFQGMSGKLTRYPKLILIYIIEKFEALRGFWKFLNNPREALMNSTKPRNHYPELLKNPIYGSHKFINLPGVKMHYVENGPKDNELLLFVHGFPDFWYSWKHQILEFSKDHWVVAVDMRGYGDTEKSKKVCFYKIELLVNDLKNLVMALGRKKFTLLAHDWGGVVAHYFIRIYPQMLNKYILINTVFHPKLGDCLISDFKQFLKSWYILVLKIDCYGEYFLLSNDLKKIQILYEDVLSEEELEVYKFMFGSYGKIRGPINYYRANFTNWKKCGIPNEDILNRENVCGLYIHGEDDFALTQNMAFTRSFEGVKNIQLACVPKAGHFAHIHRPQEVNKIIRSFLQSADRPNISSM